jgi:triphosphoribosyl-dephospho-CoA synthetase
MGRDHFASSADACSPPLASFQPELVAHRSDAASQIIFHRSKRIGMERIAEEGSNLNLGRIFAAPLRMRLRAV